MNYQVTIPPHYYNNDYDLKFFNQISHDDFINLAETCSVDDNCDIAQTMPYIKPNSTILDFGAGYGRVIEFLTRHLPKAKLYSIETCERLYKLVARKYPNCTTIYGNILDDDNPLQSIEYDNALIMWGTITSFAKQEQYLLVKRLCQSLKKNGLLFIDVPIIGKVNHINEINSIINNCNGNSLYFHMPTKKDIAIYTKENKVTLTKTIKYTTKKKSSRLIYILKK